jgi:uncharacterized protein YecT (DUF1311 family)
MLHLLKMILLLLVFGFVSSMAGAASPEKKPADFPRLDKCLNKADGDFSMTMDCYVNEYSRQEARMNNAYTNIMTDEEIDEEQKELLSASQKGWIAYRDTYSSLLYGGAYGGTLDRLGSMWWSVKSTAGRALELEEYSQ